VLETVRARDRSVQALLNSTRPLAAQRELVTLWVAHQFARDQLSQARKKRLVEDALSQVFSRRCRVEYKLADASDRDYGSAHASEVAPDWTGAPDIEHQLGRPTGPDEKLADASGNAYNSTGTGDYLSPTSEHASTQGSSPASSLADDPVVKAMTEIGGQVRPMSEGSET
jgi:hypothetical protein